MNIEQVCQPLAMIPPNGDSRAATGSTWNGCGSYRDGELDDVALGDVDRAELEHAPGREVLEEQGHHAVIAPPPPVLSAPNAATGRPGQTLSDPHRGSVCPKRSDASSGADSSEPPHHGGGKAQPSDVLDAGADVRATPRTVGVRPTVELVLGRPRDRAAASTSPPASPNRSSTPASPQSQSVPASPWMVSVPSPPWIRSVFVPPFSVSFPISPQILSSPAPPSMVSFPSARLSGPPYPPRR